MSRPRPITVLRLLFVLVFVGLLSYAVFFAEWRPLGVEEIKRDLLLFGPHAPFMAALLQAMLVVFLVPGFLLIIATALLFGYESIWISVLGQSLGALACYTIARFTGHEFVRSLLGQRVIPLQRVLEDHAFRYLVLLRLFWFIPLPLLTYGPGFVRVRFRTFLGATAIGELPFIVVMGLFAPRLLGLRRATDALDPQFVVPAALLLVMLLLPVAIAFRRKHARPAAPPIPGLLADDESTRL